MDVNVTMTIKTCHTCGSLYSVPNWVGFARCPMCAGRRIAQLEHEAEALRRSAAALRGAVSRSRGGRAS